jgi:hypothetical protein
MDSAYLFSAQACARTLIPVVCTHDMTSLCAHRGLHCITRWLVPPLSMPSLWVLIVRPDPWCHISMLDVHSLLLALQSTQLKYRPWLPPHLSIQWEFEGQS